MNDESDWRGQVWYEITLSSISMLHPNALVAWDRADIPLPHSEHGNTILWGFPDWNERFGPVRDDGIGCIFIGYYPKNRHPGMFFRCVLVKDDADPLGCRWIRSDL